MEKVEKFLLLSILGTRQGGDLLRWCCTTSPLYKGTFPLVVYKYNGPVMGLSAPNQEIISRLFGSLCHYSFCLVKYFILVFNLCH